MSAKSSRGGFARESLVVPCKSLPSTIIDGEPEVETLRSCNGMEREGIRDAFDDVDKDEEDADDEEEDGDDGICAVGDDGSG